MKKRIMSGILMAIIFIPCFLFGGYFFAILTGLLGVLALTELISLKKYHNEIPSLMVFISMILLLLLIFGDFQIALTFLVLFLPCLFYKEKYQYQDALYLSSYVLFLGFLFNRFLFIRENNLYDFIYLILLAVFTDIFAMFIGRCFGKHKCSPTISPYKTWEGSIGGTIVGTLVATTFYFMAIGNENCIQIILMTIILSIIGQLGDLIFSKIKRENQIKDFSNLIPGHGGILDRLDSLLFIILAFSFVSGCL